MIRRDWIDETGRPCWVLISQVDHAHLAGQLANAWGADPFSRVEPQAEAIAAIRHHDDGWTAWDSRPIADKTGRPPNFPEMGADVSVEIWRRSIESAAAVGPLAQYMIAGHFCALLHRFRSWRSAAPPERTAAEGFLARYERQMAVWLDEWIEAALALHTRGLGETALRHLQFFDTLSLWLCTAEKREPLNAQSADGQQIAFIPHSASLLQARPWPFQVPVLELEIPGHVLPVGTYPAGTDLTDAAQRTVIVDVRIESEAGRR